MAKKLSAPKKVEWKGYLSVYLSAEDEVSFDVWEKDRVFGLADVSILVDNGYKFSVGWDAHHNGFVASLYSADAKLAWTGWTLTAWADDVNDAVRLLMFKHYVLCEQDWERFTNRTERTSRRFG